MIRFKIDKKVGRYQTLLNVVLLVILINKYTFSNIFLKFPLTVAYIFSLSVTSSYVFSARLALMLAMDSRAVSLRYGGSLCFGVCVTKIKHKKNGLNTTYIGLNFFSSF